GRLDDGTWIVELGDSNLSDLTILGGAPISTLRIEASAITDLTPLRGMPLKTLRVSNNGITDLSPLAGTALELLHVGGTKITDLSALRGMPLTHVRLHGCADLTDLSPLADCKALQTLTLPPNATDIEFLRALPRLERIGFKEDTGGRPDSTVARFWKQYDAQ